MYSEAIQKTDFTRRHAFERHIAHGTTYGFVAAGHRSMVKTAYEKLRSHGFTGESKQGGGIVSGDTKWNFTTGSLAKAYQSRSLSPSGCHR